MPLLETKGAGSAQGFGLSLGGEEAVYVEDVFSTFLYNGSATAKTITNGIDLAGEGGLVWTKWRSGVYGAISNGFWDTERGVKKGLVCPSTAAQVTFSTNGVTSFNSDGFTALATTETFNAIAPDPNALYVSWTFRKQPKFFDIVTYTGDGSANKVISHNLGSTPGAIIVKSTSATGDWPVLHRSLTAGNSLYLNSTVAQGANADWGNPYTAPTATTFNVSYGNTNASGVTYVAYLFAHDAGGFGLTGTDNVISCGSVSGSSTVNLGWEPQWLLVKLAASAGQDWGIVDNMRGVPTPVSGNTPYAAVLNPNLSSAESTSGLTEGPAIFNATGFKLNPDTTVAGTHIYIAIRRGPMEVPTSGTQVYTPIARTGTGANATIASGFTTDLQIVKSRSQPYSNAWFDRLRGTGIALFSDSTVADQNYGAVLNFQNNTGVNISSETLINQSGQTFANWSFKRAPGFFDEVCYTGTGVASTVAHNLAAVPELMIIKSRNTGSTNWAVYSLLTPTTYRYNTLQTGSAGTGRTYGPGGSPNFEELSAQPTSTVINLASSAESNASGRTFVAYLFATLAGVSKVGSYTGTGTTQVINCGFTAGARFILIKRTDSTGDWYVWDSARGIVAGDDPYLLLNSTAAEVTNTDYVDTASTGFEISSTAPAAINASGGTFIFLAIA